MSLVYQYPYYIFTPYTRKQFDFIYFSTNTNKWWPWFNLKKHYYACFLSDLPNKDLFCGWCWLCFTISSSQLVGMLWLTPQVIGIFLSSYSFEYWCCLISFLKKDVAAALILNGVYSCSFQIYFTQISRQKYKLDVVSYKWFFLKVIFSVASFMINHGGWVPLSLISSIMLFHLGRTSANIYMSS